MAKKKNDVSLSNLSAWGAVAFAAVFVFSVSQNVASSVTGVTDAPNSYALVISLLLSAYNYNVTKRLRVLTLVSLVMLATAGFIWYLGLHGVLQY